VGVGVGVDMAAHATVVGGGLVVGLVVESPKEGNSDSHDVSGGFSIMGLA
jgi:hypothetical protein